jgi:hypothetical protein
VYDAWHGFFGDNYTDPVFTRTGGAAACTARLVDWSSSGKERTLATSSSSAAG